MPAFVKAASLQISNFKGLKFTSNDLHEAFQVANNLKDDQTMFFAADTVNILT